MERTDNQKKRYTSPTLQVVEFKVEKGFADSQQQAAPTQTLNFFTSGMGEQSQSTTETFTDNSFGGNGFWD